MSAAKTEKPTHGWELTSLSEVEKSAVNSAVDLADSIGFQSLDFSMNFSQGLDKSVIAGAHFQAAAIVYAAQAVVAAIAKHGLEVKRLADAMASQGGNAA